MKLDPWEKEMADCPILDRSAWHLAAWDWALIACCTVAFLYWFFYS